MATLNGFHKGNITIVDKLEVMGTIEGNVTVLQSCVLELKGTVIGSCRVESGGIAKILGTVRGVLENHRGDIEIWGVVQLLRDCDSAVPSIVKPGAQIKNYEVGTCG